MNDTERFPWVIEAFSGEVISRAKSEIEAIAVKQSFTRKNPYHDGAPYTINRFNTENDRLEVEQ